MECEGPQGPGLISDGEQLAVPRLYQRGDLRGGTDDDICFSHLTSLAASTLMELTSEVEITRRAARVFVCASVSAPPSQTFFKALLMRLN